MVYGGAVNQHSSEDKSVVRISISLHEYFNVQDFKIADIWYAQTVAT